MNAPTFLSLFAGIGGFDLALERVGLRCVGQVEIDDFAQRVLALRFPHAARRSDCRQWQGDGHEPVAVLVGGFPCQGASVAGKRLGLADDRTALFWEICRIQDQVKATWGLFENVPGLRSVTLGRDFEAVLAALKERWPVVGWRTLDSRYFGVAQRRARVFFVCGPDEARVASVLFEPEGGAGHLAAGREAGSGVAASLTSGSHGARVNEPGRRQEDDVNLVVADMLSVGANQTTGFVGEAVVGALRQHVRPGSNTDHTVAHPVTATSAKRHDEDTDTLVVGALRHLGSGGPDDDEAQANHLVAHALTGEGHDASEDGTGRGTPLAIGFAWQSGGDVRLQAKEEEGTHHANQVPAVLAFDTTQVTSRANRSAPQAGDPCHPLAASAHAPAIAGMAVRRLTPVECERLQGFPDGWTCLDVPLEDWAHDPESAAERCQCPDSPRYRTMGNAVTVNVIEWIGRQLIQAITR